MRAHRRPHATARRVFAGSIAIATAMNAHAALACGGGSSGGGGGGGGGGAGGVLGAILGAVGDAISAAGRHAPSRSAPRDSAPSAGSSGSAPAQPSGDASPVEITYTQAADPPRAVLPPPPPGANDSPVARAIEASAGFAWATLQPGSLPWTGWQQHPILGQQVDSYDSAPGHRLGMNRASMIGATLRFNAIIADIVTLGPSVTFLQQVDTNGTVQPGSTPFGAERIRTLEYGGQVGVLGRVGPVSLRAELFVGHANSWAVITGLGTAGCDAPPTVTQDHWVITPRAMITGAVAHHVTIGAYAGVDTLHFGDWSGGVVIAFHGGGFATETADVMAQ